MREKVKIAVIGMGNMGCPHARDVNDLPNTELVAVCDIDRARADMAAAQYGVKAYYDYRDLRTGADLDAILIATPHYDHTPISIAALTQGTHVLVEKPIAAHAKDARKMIAAYELAKEKYPGLVFSAMFMQRTYGHYLKIKDLIDSGELGQLVRATWIITDWFRPQVYYDSGGWRATWAGEGGGVLLNQCPHNLDLYQWFVGMPRRVTGFAAIGKYHHIEVEDEVTAYFEYDHGPVGHFITTTAESPGTNRLELVGENGKLIFENGKLTFYRNRQSTFKFIREATGSFDKVENWVMDVPFKHHGQPGHSLIIENFANAILHGETLIAPAAEGLNSVMLGNAIMLSSFLKKTVDIPFDEDAYEEKLQALIRRSKFQKTAPTIETTNADMSRSFH
ncbi:MAG: Gfo/Idh/MocA family oxidoreductase [Anaerolineae bacterium]|nr:Gfo/Idh/MocA family oxidoreductase [Anaerolineae bacterium]